LVYDVIYSLFYFAAHALTEDLACPCPLVTIIMLSQCKTYRLCSARRLLKEFPPCRYLLIPRLQSLSSEVGMREARILFKLYSKFSFFKDMNRTVITAISIFNCMGSQLRSAQQPSTSFRTSTPFGEISFTYK